MSYATPQEWWAGYHAMRHLHETIVATGNAEALTEVGNASDAYWNMMELAGVLYASPFGFPLYMTAYQRDNLTKFLDAVKTHSDTTMRTWDTGDWWGEVLHKILGIGGQIDKGNPHYTQEDPVPLRPILPLDIAKLTPESFYQLVRFWMDTARAYADHEDRPTELDSVESYLDSAAEWAEAYKLRKAKEADQPPSDT